MQSTDTRDRATPAEKIQYWLDFAEANRPGHDSLRGVSYGPAPIRQEWVADVLVSLAAERDRADRAEARVAEAPHADDCCFDDVTWAAGVVPLMIVGHCTCWKSEATA